MKPAPALNGFTAAATVIKWLRAWYGAAEIPVATDLDLVRRILPHTPYGRGVREILAPLPIEDAQFEGLLARDPNDPAVWGIAYNAKARPERQRFTIAHELGHFVLHRNKRLAFSCDQASVHLGLDTLAGIEREADEFASNLLMPGDVLREAIAHRRVDLHLLSDLAGRFQVSFEALCIRFIHYTSERAILVRWDNGYLTYEWRSKQAQRTRTKVWRTSNPQEPLPGTLAADATTTQAWDGVDLPAHLWCPSEPQDMTLTEFKHSYRARERVLSLLILPSREQRPSYDHKEALADTFDRFIERGQFPVR